MVNVLSNSQKYFKDKFFIIKGKAYVNSEWTSFLFLFPLFENSFIQNLTKPSGLHNIHNIPNFLITKKYFYKFGSRYEGIEY